MSYLVNDDEVFAELVGQSTSVRILARPSGYWNNTGVQIGERDYVRIVAGSESWYINPGWPGPVSAGGSTVYTSASPSYALPGFPEGALIGKVGGRNDDFNDVFPVGLLAAVPPGKTGTLWLTANDQRPGTGPGAGYGDNSGSIVVDIMISPIPW